MQQSVGRSLGGGRGTDGPVDGLACQAGKLRQEPSLLQEELGLGEQTGSEDNPFLGAAGKLGPSPVVSKVTGGGLWTQCPA